MQDNTITADGVDVYLSEIDMLCDEYLQTLDEPESITKATSFLGLLKYIYVHLFRPDKTMRYNANSILVNSSADDISRLWDKFAEICYRYGNTPTILKFCTMTGIERATLWTWKTGQWRNSSSEYSDTAQKMYQEAESALESKAVESNGIGAIFALKANFQWRETAPVAPEELPQPKLDTPEQIAARHASAALKMPEKPDI